VAFPFTMPPPFTTIADRLATRRHGFDWLRLGLAIGIMGFHAFPICQGNLSAMPGWAQSGAALILPMFFALSGFLVSASLARAPSLRHFLLLRGLRLGPGLALAVLAAAFVLGPLLTETPAHYFNDPQLLAYLRNLTGETRYQLPGLFLHNPRGGVVNGTLWTIPQELLCYVLLGFAALLGVTRRRATLVLALAAAALVVLLLNCASPLVPAPGLVLAFFSGVLLFRSAALVPLHGGLALAGLALALVLLRPGHDNAIAMLPLAYATVWLGLRDAPRLPGDYSYGLYLAGYPLQQVYSQLFPGMRVWWADLAFALPLALLFAGLSWHLVEGPVLARRHRIAALLADRQKAAPESAALSPAS
jgi:peptidoglycan/LPS O-acetylase OafA/YrhL